MKTFSVLSLEYDCPVCAATTEVEIKFPSFGESVPTCFSCRECGQKNVLTVRLDPDERKGRRK